MRRLPFQTIDRHVGRTRWSGAVRPRADAAFWTAAATISLAAFRLGQVRLQPDAIATGVPGLLFRAISLLVAAGSDVVFAATTSVALQAAVLMTIFYAYPYYPLLRRGPGEGSGPLRVAERSE
ncbi:hypothetical protein SAMN04488094_10196 [Tropicimonas isoalkanivorans]|uniref:Uncharacterized protein n=1 Tax=Tropicimonas isoalkanivorans TaxID=441112 RepID=A0A1I1DA76_9RHOB|nr:hypothetical protein SAMN04488094_10196 [Tropicimonas isoalkanivorans]